MKFRKCMIAGIVLLSMFGLTACTNSSSSSSSETKVAVPVKKSTDDTPVYNKRFSVYVNSNNNNISSSENNKLVNKADKWIAEQNLKEYTPHITQYVVDGAGDPNVLDENVTMVKKE